MIQYRMIIILILCSQFVAGQELDKYKDLITLNDNVEVVKSNIKEVSSIDLKRFWFDNPQERRYGFIGSNYQRLDIKFLSVIKNTDNPNQYFVYGKSRVSKNICRFQGLLEIKGSYYIKSSEYFNDTSGIILGEYIFYEDPDSKHSGIFKGRFVTYWFKSENGEFKYMWLPATEGNNQFAGDWTQYGKKDGKVANWGDSRLPESGDLDVGTSEFGVNKKYQDYGWDSFIKAHFGGYDKETTSKARQEELSEWWKE